MSEMTAESWSNVRLRWEEDPRSGYVWLVRELGLPVSAQAVRKMAIKNGWAKTTPSDEGIKFLFPPSKGERNGKYRKQFTVLANRLSKLGITGADLADFFDVSETTIAEWKRRHPEFAWAIKDGGMIADANVASRLYQRAIGYTYEAEEIHIVDGRVVRELVVKHCCPDVRAAIFWLTNRQPKLWKHHVETVDKPTIAIVDKEAMNNMYERVLAEAEIKRKELSGRAERLGMVIDSGEVD